jgi:hypothetical protein
MKDTEIKQLESQLPTTENKFNGINVVMQQMLKDQVEFTNKARMDKIRFENYYKGSGYIRSFEDWKINIYNPILLAKAMDKYKALLNKLKAEDDRIESEVNSKHEELMAAMREQSQVVSELRIKYTALAREDEANEASYHKRIDEIEEMRGASLVVCNTIQRTRNHRKEQTNEIKLELNSIDRAEKIARAYDLNIELGGYYGEREPAQQVTAAAKLNYDEIIAASEKTSDESFSATESFLKENEINPDLNIANQILFQTLSDKNKLEDYKAILTKIDQSQKESVKQYIAARDALITAVKAERAISLKMIAVYEQLKECVYGEFTGMIAVHNTSIEELRNKMAKDDFLFDDEKNLGLSANRDGKFLRNIDDFIESELAEMVKFQEAKKVKAPLVVVDDKKVVEQKKSATTPALTVASVPTVPDDFIKKDLAEIAELKEAGTQRKSAKTPALTPVPAPTKPVIEAVSKEPIDNKALKTGLTIAGVITILIAAALIALVIATLLVPGLQVLALATLGVVGLTVAAVAVGGVGTVAATAGTTAVVTSALLPEQKIVQAPSAAPKVDLPKPEVKQPEVAQEKKNVIILGN